MFSTSFSLSLRTERKTKLRLSLCELLCPFKILKNNLNLQILQKIQNFILKNISVENLIKKNIKLDQLASLALSESQLIEYNSNIKPVFDLDKEKEKEKEKEYIESKRLNDSKNVQASLSNTNCNLKNFP